VKPCDRDTSSNKELHNHQMVQFGAFHWDVQLPWKKRFSQLKLHLIKSVTTPERTNHLSEGWLKQNGSFSSLYFYLLFMLKGSFKPTVWWHTWTLYCRINVKDFLKSVCSKLIKQFVFNSSKTSQSQNLLRFIYFSLSFARNRIRFVELVWGSFELIQDFPFGFSSSQTRKAAIISEQEH